MISIIIPARNESTVIARTLRAMITSAEPGEIDVVVVCNGCDDDTATVARSFGPPVRVLETQIGSKTHALNLGDQAAAAFPRLYADADVVITIKTVRALAARLEQGNVLAVAPKACVNQDSCTWCVRAYYEIRSRLPSAREGIGGSGVYALSATGRQRFSKFPNIVADDGYVRIQFKPSERETLLSANSVVFAPRSIKDLILIRTRAYYGTMELRRLFSNFGENSGERNHKTVLSLAKFPFLWPKLALYCYVNTIARYKAIARFWSGNFSWQQDKTSRNIIAAQSDALRDELP